MRLRFAPSPTGQLHVGNARTALFNWLLARGNDGTLILRIEDTDAERSTKESEDSILQDLRWLGLEWDEGPDVGGSRGPYRQSERLHLYQSYAQELLAAGAAYYCFCSTSQLDAERQAAVAAGLPAQYAGTCRRLSQEQVTTRMAAGERPAIRFRVPDRNDVVFTDAVRGDVRFQTDIIGDPIIVRADGTPAYNFAVVVDDALMEITHVIRGEDHISNTPRQVLLYEAACNPDPVLRLTGVNRALEGLAIDVFNTMKEFGAASTDPVLEFCEDWMLADEVTHVKMGSDWLRRLTEKDPDRRERALEFQRTVDKIFNLGGFRGEDEENPVQLARRFRHLAGFTDEENDSLAELARESTEEARVMSEMAVASMQGAQEQTT